MKRTAVKKKPRRKSNGVNGARNGWMKNHAVDRDAVSLFCSRHDLFQDVGRAVALVKTNLQPRKLRVVIEGDPEGSGEWLILDADMVGSVDEVLACYHRFKEQWRVEIPPAPRALMRVLVNIIAS
ncbi:MAG TPA: hypothetical protein VKE98_24760 [Gemmataceae bacterium]|nr:hypothetical protein [Gemmataceae bacterium]